MKKVISEPALFSSDLILNLLYAYRDIQVGSLLIMLFISLYFLVVLFAHNLFFDFYLFEFLFEYQGL